MRYYVCAVQHNKEKGAENRSVPSAFDTLLEAKQKFYSTLGSDINNATLDWGVVFVLGSDGNLYMTDKWERENND